MTGFDLNLFPIKSCDASVNSRLNLHSSPETISARSGKCLLEKSYYNLGLGKVSTSSGQNDSEVSLDLQLAPPHKPHPKFNWLDTQQESDAENINLSLALEVDLIKPERYDERFRDHKEAEFDLRNSFGRKAKCLNKDFVVDLNRECVESDADADMPTNSSEPLESFKIFGKVILNSKGHVELEPTESSEPNNSGHQVFDDFDMPTNSSKPLESFKIFGKVIHCSKGHDAFEPTESSEPKNSSGNLVFDDFDGNDHGTSKVDYNIVECNKEIKEFEEVQEEGTLYDVSNRSQNAVKKLDAIQEELSCDSASNSSHNAIEKLDFVQEELCRDNEPNSSHAAVEKLEASQEESSYDSESNCSHNAIEGSTREELSCDNEANSSYNTFEKLQAQRELTSDAESYIDVNRELEHENPHHENGGKKDDELVKECLVEQSQESSLNGNYGAGREKYIRKPEESNGKPLSKATWKGRRAWGTISGVDKDIVEDNGGRNTKQEQGTKSGLNKDKDNDVVETCKKPAWKRKRTWVSASVINKNITEENEGNRKHAGKRIAKTAKNPTTWKGEHAWGATSGLDGDIVEEIEERNGNLERVSKLGLDKDTARKTERSTWKGKCPRGEISGLNKSFIEENEDENTRNEWGTKSGLYKDFEVGDHEVQWAKHSSLEKNFNNRSSYKQAKPNYKRDGYYDKSFKRDGHHNDCHRDDRRKGLSHRSDNHTNRVNQFGRKRVDDTWVRKVDGLRGDQKFPRNENACEVPIPLPASRMHVHDTGKGLIQNAPNYQIPQERHRRSASRNIIQNRGNLRFSFSPSPRSLECPPEKWLGSQRESENGYYLRNSIDPRHASINGGAREIINSSRMQYSTLPVASFQRNGGPRPIQEESFRPLQYYSHVGKQTQNVLLNERYHRPSPYGEHYVNDQRGDQHGCDLLRNYYERGVVREYDGNGRTQFGESSNGARGTREQEGKYQRKGWHDAMVNNRSR